MLILTGRKNVFGNLLESVVSRGTQRSRAAVMLGLVALLGSPPAEAQYSASVPRASRTQIMISGPSCLAYPSLMIGWKDCDDAAYDSWLADIQAWRVER